MTEGAMFGPKIDVREQLAQSRIRLLRLLQNLASDDWRRPTAAAPWTVRDLAAHLLGDDLNRLSRGRDGYSGEGPRPGESLPDFIHRINDEWVRATARISPEMVVAMLDATTPEVLAFWAAADLDAVGEPVTWAAPHPAPVWLDCARDFTEYWVHQEQIRDAIDEPGSDDPEETHAVLDTFLRAMPHTLDGCIPSEDASVTVQVEGPGGGRWSWQYDRDAWMSAENERGRSTVVTFAEADTLWRLCTRMLSPSDASGHIEAIGDDQLIQRVLRIVSIIR